MIQTSVIIVNYNTATLTVQAVNSILKYSNADTTEIIVVDNASEKEDYLQLKADLEGKPLTLLLRSRLNLGFGGGNMYGVQFARGKHYAFLNSDAYLKEDSLFILTEFLDQNSQVAVVAGIPFDEEGRQYRGFDYEFRLVKELFGDGFLRLINPGKYPSRRTVFDRPTKVGAVSGSFLVCRAADFEQVGGFDDNLFLFYEERDLSHRIRKKLKKDTYLLPGTSYVHLKGKSTPSSYLIKQELRISQFYAIRKNLGIFKYIIFFSFYFLKYLFKTPFSTKNRKYLAILLRGVPLSDSLKQKQTVKPFL